MIGTEVSAIRRTSQPTTEASLNDIEVLSRSGGVAGLETAEQGEATTIRPRWRKSRLRPGSTTAIWIIRNLGG